MKRCLSVVLILITVLTMFDFVGAAPAAAVDETAEDHEHVWAEATCTAPKTCSVCGKTEGTALGHKVEKWKTKVKPTCTEKGTKTGKCTRCGETVSKSVKATGHTVEKWTTTVKATCTKAGTKTGKCVTCGKTVKKATKLKSHEPAEKWKYLKKPTSDDRSMVRVKYCENCGAECKRQSKTLTKSEYKTWYKGQCTTKLAYKTLARKPDKYKGRKIKITGYVLQVQEGGWLSPTVLRVATKDRWDNIYYVTYYGTMNSRILEDDKVTIWGEFQGLKTYTTIFGASVTIPLLDAEFYSIK